MTRIWFRTTLAMLFGALVLCLVNGSADAGWRHRRGRCGGCDGWNGGCYGGRHHGGGGCCGGYGGGCSGGGYYSGGKYGGAYYGGGTYYSGNGYYRGRGIPVAPNVGPDYAPSARSARGVEVEGGARVDSGIRSESDRIRAGADIEGRARVDEGGARARTERDAPPLPPAEDRPSDARAPRSDAPPAESPAPEAAPETP
jgi:hypothetical protein